MNLLNTWNLLSGKKTYIVGICAIIYGIYAKSPDTIVIGLGLMGLRNGITTEIANLAK